MTFALCAKDVSQFRRWQTIIARVFNVLPSGEHFIQQRLIIRSNTYIPGTHYFQLLTIERLHAATRHADHAAADYLNGGAVPAHDANVHTL